MVKGNNSLQNNIKVFVEVFVASILSSYLEEGIKLNYNMFADEFNLSKFITKFGIYMCVFIGTHYLISFILVIVKRNKFKNEM